ncbi:hypothetical protein K4A83_14395 [Spirulina subsalsa FACHB-351]|jgi:hypothetical protein|uniref:Uncharacterized protein n=1 Tax=Spirulina subsalsa FACHB-351 TaxID=234711 RepID=A0ABT3L7F6_9CYAN|nr:hypothetical protein [Spirulina subsalsa FACHB-351]
MTKSKRKLTPKTALKRLKHAFQQELGISSATATGLLDGAKLYDKAYELSCVIQTVQELKAQDPSRSFVLVGGSSLTFRNKGGPIQRSTWPYVEVRTQGHAVAELWVDIEFTALSAWKQNKNISYPTYGLAHELDILLVKPKSSDRPTPDQIYLGIEAKHREFSKALLKELLGVRREMCYKSKGKNLFAWWQPIGILPASPASGLVLFCSGANVPNYTDPATFWGLCMVHKSC